MYMCILFSLSMAFFSSHGFEGVCGKRWTNYGIIGLRDAEFFFFILSLYRSGHRFWFRIDRFLYRATERQWKILYSLAVTAYKDEVNMFEMWHNGFHRHHFTTIFFGLRRLPLDTHTYARIDAACVRFSAFLVTSFESLYVSFFLFSWYSWNFVSVPNLNR